MKEWKREVGIGGGGGGRGGEYLKTAPTTNCIKCLIFKTRSRHELLNYY